MCGVYLIAGGNTVKIGRGVDISKRFRDIQAMSPVPLRLARFVRTGYLSALEGYLHRRYAEHRQHGEWFRAEPVLADVARLTNVDLLRAAGATVKVVGRQRDLARWLGTDDGRYSAEHMSLDFEATP